MIIGFSVANFRSFLSIQSLSFVASSDDSHEATHCVPTRFNAVPRLTRTAAVVGPNGSGKSNLLLALRTMRELVLHSASYSEADFAQKYAPFHGQPSRQTPTTFSIDVLLGGMRYRYGFSYDARRIVHEQLHVYQSRRPQRWFEREYLGATGGETWLPFSANFPGPRETWRKATQPRALFLTTAAELHAEAFMPLMHWFKHQLDVALTPATDDLKPLAGRLRTVGFKERLVEILREVDLPVADVRVAEPGAADAPSARAPASGMAPRPSIQFLYAHRGTPPVWLDAQEDSAGARRLVTLAASLLDGFEHDRLVAIDEFDTYLHPLVTRFLMETINDPAATHRHVQVLLASHTTTLLDLELLRRDEIWLMELDDDHASRLTPLPEHSPRRHEMIAKAYLQGRYGAVPKLGAER
jgi:uncharacterized protein